MLQLVLFYLFVSPPLWTNAQRNLDYDYQEDSSRTFGRRRPSSGGSYNQQFNPCGRFFGLSYINLNYNIDCGHSSNGGYGGGHGGGGSHGGGHGGHHNRPQRPSHNHHQHQQSQHGAAGPAGGFFDRPIFNGLGNLAYGLGSLGTTFASNFNNNPAGGGAGSFFDLGGVVQSFSSLFSGFGNTGTGSSSSPTSGSSNPFFGIFGPGLLGFGTPQQTGSGPVGGGGSVGGSSGSGPSSQFTTSRPVFTTNNGGGTGPVVPIVDARPVHEYYDEVTEAYGGATNKLPPFNYYNGYRRNKRNGGDVFSVGHTPLFRHRAS